VEQIPDLFETFQKAYDALTIGMKDIPVDKRDPDCEKLRKEAKRLLRRVALTCNSSMYLAAPDLYKACKHVVDIFTGRQGLTIEEQFALDKAYHALTKAGGSDMRELPKPGELWRHFKGSVYQIVTVAVHTDSGERFVIYRSNNGKLWARPLEMFLEEVPEGKENPTGQKYRFERK